MYSHQIVTILQNDHFVRQQFGRVVAANELPLVITKRPSIYIVNTDVKGLPGTHWTVFYFPKRGLPEFFDSFGRAPAYFHNRFVNVLRRNGPRFIYNKYQVQPYGSTTCGQYSILYAKYRCRGWTMKQIVNKLQHVHMV